VENNNPKVVSFRDLVVWQKGLSIAKQSYVLCKLLPREESFGLISQIQRCSVSIPSNIAEGRGRSTAKDFSQFLHIAQGSLYELETQLLLAKELYGLKTEEIIQEIHIEQKMLSGLIKNLKPNTIHQ
jgi:four helix bundle protein